MIHESLRLINVGDNSAGLDSDIVQDIHKQKRRLKLRPPKGPWAKLGRAVGLLVQEAVEDHVCPLDTPGAWSDVDLQEIKDRILCSFPLKKDHPGAVRVLLDKLKERIRNVRGWTLGLLKHIRVDGESIDEETLRCMFSEFIFIYINVYIIIYITKNKSHIYIYNHLAPHYIYINICLLLANIYYEFI